MLTSKTTTFVGNSAASRSERIKLLTFLTFFFIGGTERQVVNLLRGLNRSDFDLHLACLGRRGQFLGEIESQGIPIFEYPTKNLYNHLAWKQRLQFARQLRQSAIDIVHTYGFYANAFAVPAAWLAGTAVIVASIRDTGELLTPAQRFAQKLVCRLADCVLVNADAVRRWLIGEGYAPEKIHVIRNGIAFRPVTGNGHAARLRQELGLPPDVPLIGVLSRLNRLKGIEYFLEAAANMGRRARNARFLVIGDGRHRKELEQYAARLGLGERVIFTGFRLDVPEVLSALTISVLPSLSEGLSNSLLESMAAGLPVIATNVGGNPEAVEDGVTGLIVRPRDSDALARGMALLLENPDLAAEFGEAGKRRVAERFSLEHMVLETESLYSRLLDRTRVVPAGEYVKGPA